MWKIIVIFLLIMFVLCLHYLVYNGMISSQKHQEIANSTQILGTLLAVFLAIDLLSGQQKLEPSQPSQPSQPSWPNQPVQSTNEQRDTVCDLVRKSRQDPEDMILQVQAFYLLNQAFDLAKKQNFPVNLEKAEEARKIWATGEENPEKVLSSYREAFVGCRPNQWPEAKPP